MIGSPYEQMKPGSFCTKTVSSTSKSPTLPFFFFFWNILATSIDFPPPPSGNIHRCAKPPLTATLAEAKNEIYTWLPSSTMCNHHLIGKWSRVQTGRGKAWLKPTSPRADDTPTTKTRHTLSSEEHELCSDPQPLASTNRQNRSRSTKGKYFSLRSGVLANKSQIHQEKPRRWGLSSEHSHVQQWHSPSLSTQRQ